MRTALRQLRWLLHTRRREADLRAELDFHLEEDRDDAMAAGSTEAEARVGARRGLGNRTLIEEDVRAAWGWIWIERLGQDVRYAVRMVRRRPALTATAILTLALGVGANTAVFGLLYALVLRELPVDRPDTLVRMIEQGVDPASYRDTFTLVTHTILQRSSTALSDVIASSQTFARPGEIEERGEKQPAFVQLVSDNYFDGLGVGALRGRVFQPPAPGSTGEPIAVISEDYWRRHYGADPAAIGARFRYGRHDLTIAGVAAAGFRGTELDVPVDVWIPFEQIVAPTSPDRVRGRWMRVMARVRAGAPLVHAQAEAAALLGRPVRLEPGGTGYSGLRRRLSRPLLLVELVVVLVLLITCANLANLMLAATAARERELAVRRSLGASRARVLRQLMTESLLIAAGGGVGAIGVAQWITAGLLYFLPPEQAPALVNLRMGAAPLVLGFAAALSCGACLLFGLVPAWRASRAVGKDFRAGAGISQPQRSWMSRGLLISQIVMCTLLLMLAGVFLRTLQNLRGQSSGYDEAQLLVADVAPPRELLEDARDELIEQLRARVAALPGIVSAGFSSHGQLSGGAIEYHLAVPGLAAPVDAIELRVSPGFLGTMGTRFLSGRDVAPSDDTRGAAVAIVNETFARRFLPGRDPIGLRFAATSGSRANDPVTIIAVVEDSKWVNLRDDYPAMYYRPYSQQAGSPVVRLAIRSSGDLTALAADVRQLAPAVDPRMALTNVVPFVEVVNRTLVTERLVARVSTAFGVLALLVAAIGLYGVLAYGVARRRREIGVRIAVGAPPGAVEWMILRESLAVLACGVAIGVPAALAVTRLAASMLFGVSPQDPASIGAAVGVLLVATIAAAYLPARRAAAIDPVRALRDE